MSTATAPHIVQLGFQRADLNSSMLEYAEFLAPDELLRVRFANGDMYEYRDVPAEQFKALCEADSHGKYFGTNIKDMYPTFKLTEV